ncbi:YbaY family lipoprotein [Pseudotabrizicola alkalilacus]|uniref:YbaY family lipoprotein n=1 Tax=Pseudotabrizicola alkalilacus TaxID=2305252 RepID=UPI0013148AD5|nr:YbaY family lipoprotein [Pseudotabrizicola alkalilacus]
MDWRSIMRIPASTLLLFLAFIAMASAVAAQSTTIDAAVSYRERIALPPDAQLDLRLVEVSQQAAGAKRIASQRFSISSVPRILSLSYDPEVVNSQSRLILVAAIWSGDVQIFRTTEPYEVLDAMQSGPIEMWLAMVTESDLAAVPPRTITGIAWSVTEVGGEAWGTDDPATFAIDYTMNFSIFGGCNRFSGRLLLVESEILFPEDFAGTLMACSDEAEAEERRLLGALRQVSGYVRYAGGLVLIDPAGNTLVHFIERPE